MDYWVFDLIFLVLPAALLLRGLRPPRALLVATAALAGVALLWTAPWDEHLVRTGVWSYGPDRVLATIGSVPAEEYAFVVLLVVLVAAWGLRTGRLPALPVAPRGSRTSGALGWLAVALAGAAAVAVGGPAALPRAAPGLGRPAARAPAGGRRRPAPAAAGRPGAARAAGGAVAVRGRPAGAGRRHLVDRAIQQHRDPRARPPARGGAVLPAHHLAGRRRPGAGHRPRRPRPGPRAGQAARAVRSRHQATVSSHVPSSGVGSTPNACVKALLSST